MEAREAPQVVIRPLQDAAEARICARVMADSEPWITLRRPYEEALNLVRDPVKEVYVATADRLVLGFIVLHLGCPFSGYIQTIAVVPEWRSRGIGRKLIEFAEERIFRESPNVFLCVSSFNSSAQRLYGRLGYERVGEFRDYVVAGYSEILMRKTTGPIGAFKSPV
jgi:[ribosomal protein S18]-alanine N-acetyltransferase